MSDSCLIVGAGPVGLTLASLLTKYGVPYRIIDQNLEPVIQTKAAGLWTKTLEALHHLGLAEHFLEISHRSYSTHFFAGGQERVHLDLSKIPSLYNFITLIPQHRTEQALREHLTAQGVSVDRGQRLVELKGRVATIESVENGQTTTSEYRYVFGTDGAHSKVRKEIGATFEGERLPGVWMVGDIVCQGEGLPADEVSMFLGADGPIAFFALGHGRYRVAALAKEAMDPVPLSFFEEAAAARIPFPISFSDPQFMTTFVINERQADIYSNGSAFLLGDAAHIHSPAGGQGLNTGIQDAFNLAWKVAQVMLWGSPESVLESYQAERHPVAKVVLEASTMATKMIGITNPVARKVQAAAMSVVGSLEPAKHRLREALSELNIHYDHSSLNTGKGNSVLKPGARVPEVFWRDSNVVSHRLYDLFTGLHWTLLSRDCASPLASVDRDRLRQVTIARLGAASQDRFSDPAGLVSAACGLDEGGHLLVRPDGYVAGYFVAGHEAELRAYWEQHCGSMTVVT